MTNLELPGIIDICVTGKCNLRCSYCSHFSGGGDVDEDLPIESWLAFFDELKTCSAQLMVISGGEPLLRRDIRELIEGVVRNGLDYKILTNGTLVTDELASFLKSTGNCKDVQVSLDSSIAATHDAFRGDGAFSRALAGIRTLKSHDVPVTVRMTIHKRNVEELEEISRLLLDEIELPNFSTCSASFMGLCRKNAEELMLSAEERSLSMEKHLRMVEKYGNRIIANAGPLAEARKWLEIREAQEGQDAQEGSFQKQPGGGFLSACDGVQDRICVRSDGMYVPCVLLSHIGLGKINEVKLRDIWFDHPELLRLRERKQVPLCSFEFCRDCEYLNFCTGSCPAVSYNAYGEDYTPSPETCFKRFILDGGRIPERLPAHKPEKATPEWIETLNEIFQD